jgi:hypothetical protein
MLSGLGINPKVFTKEANVDGPKIIFDKSFLHRLKAEHLFELDIFFDIIPAPILKMEILADLSKPETPKTDWVSVVKSLCRKMARSGIELVHYRSAALTELADGQKIPMNGALLIDLGAPHVTACGNGGIHIDGRQVQSEWRRWAEGNFTDEERQAGAKLRGEINALDMSAIQRLRKSMSPLYAHCKTSEAVIEDVRAFIDDPTPDKQDLVFGLTMSNLGIPHADQPVIRRRLSQTRAKTLREGAPYAASLTQVFFAWIALQARGFHGQRKSDICDLEYLFYAPFCKVFTSCDRLHKILWNAATTTAIWCDGFELLVDLAIRAELRKNDPERVKGPYPIPLEGSVITRIFEQLRQR